MIFVLAESEHSHGHPRFVYILNKTLAKDLNSRSPSQRGGLIFVLDTEVLSPPSMVLGGAFRVFVPSSLQGKLQLPMRVGSLGVKVEEFCLQKNLMPSGFLIVVHQRGVQLWNFDAQQDKTRMKCKLESQLVFNKNAE